MKLLVICFATAAARISRRGAVLDAGASVLIAGRVEDLIAQQPSAAVLPTADSRRVSVPSRLSACARRAVVRGAQGADGLDAQVCACVSSSYATAVLTLPVFDPRRTISLSHSPPTRSTQWDRFSLRARRLAGETLAPPPPATRAPPPPLGDGVAARRAFAAALGAATACALGGGARTRARRVARAVPRGVGREGGRARRDRRARGAARARPAGSRARALVAAVRRLPRGTTRPRAAAGRARARAASRPRGAPGCSRRRRCATTRRSRFRRAHARRGARGLVPLLGGPARPRALARAGSVGRARCARPRSTTPTTAPSCRRDARRRRGRGGRGEFRPGSAQRVAHARRDGRPAGKRSGAQARRLGLGLPGVAVATVGALGEVGVPARTGYYVGPCTARRSRRTVHRRPARAASLAGAGRFARRGAPAVAAAGHRHNPVPHVALLRWGQADPVVGLRRRDKAAKGRGGWAVAHVNG